MKDKNLSVKQIFDRLGIAKSTLYKYAKLNGDNYIQHNAAIPDQVSGLAKAMEAMAKQGITTVYAKNHMILGEGNFVLAASEGRFDGIPELFVHQTCGCP